MKIGLIGDHISDIYIHGRMTRFSPESPIPIFDAEREESRGGGASNVYNNLVNLGADVNYFCDTENFCVKRRYVCDGHIMFRVDDEKYSPYPINFVPDFTKEIKYVILSDYNKGVLKHSAELIHSLKQQGKTVIVDPKKDLRYYEGADIVKMNEKEFIKFGALGLTRKEYNIGAYVITMGSKGVKIINDDGETIIPGENIQVSDVTGAGDVFIAAMTCQLAKGKTIYQACEISNKYAARSVTKFGTYTITTEDIRAVEGKVIFTNGCFDIIHPGHIDYLRKSKELGTKLIVGLNSDASVKRLKGSNRPIHNQDDRKKVLEALDCVDQVIIFDEDTPHNLIKELKPDIITKGGDYKTKEEVVGHDLSEVVIIPYLQGYSTTKILENLNGDC